MGQESIANTDQRRFTRIPFDAQVELTMGSSAAPIQRQGILTDISFKGLMITVDSIDDLQLDTQGSALIKLAAHEVCFQLEIMIRHIKERSLGLEVQKMPIEAAQHLRSLMHHNLAEEHLLQREFNALINQTQK